MDKILEPAAKTLAESIPTVKTCAKCGAEKLLSEFSLSKVHKLGRSHWCKSCTRDYWQSYNQRPDSIKRIWDYRRLTKTKERRRSYLWVYRRKPKNKAKQAAYKRIRLKNDHAFRLTHNIRVRINRAIKGQIKSNHTIELVGCDVGFLRRWLEAKFLPGMTWENYGDWHVDHIMPCASFDLSDPVQQRTCFRWTNLQPLWEKENLAKSDKVE